MKILIYGLNFSPELTGIGKYTGEMVHWLTQQGHQCRVITAPPYYPDWTVNKNYSSWRYRKEVIDETKIYRCPLWVPKHPQTIKRLLHLTSFALSSLPVLIRQLSWKADVVICIAPAFFCAPGALLYSRLSHAKSWLHIQDFEIDAMVGLGMTPRIKWLTRFAYALAKTVFRKFDRVSSISNTMCQTLQKKGASTNAVTYFPNWVDTAIISPNGDAKKYRQRWNVDNNDIMILYSGNLGKKQGLDLILDTAKSLSNEIRFRFIIVGEGAEKDHLIKKAKQLQLNNIQFHPLQPYESLPDLLCAADIHLVLQKRGTADAVLPSKVTGILAAGGHAIITAEENTELGHILKENPHIATLIPPESKNHLINAINKLANTLTQKENRTHNVNALIYAKNNFGLENILYTFEESLLNLQHEKEDKYAVS